MNAKQGLLKHKGSQWRNKYGLQIFEVVTQHFIGISFFIHLYVQFEKLLV